MEAWQSSCQRYHACLQYPTYLFEAMGGVLNQTCKRLEIIVDSDSPGR